MKKIGVILTFLVFSIAMFAQDSAAELKNAGNEALRNKNYAEAVAKYEAYFATNEEGVADDNMTLYNLANSALKAKDFAKAEKYFNQCVAKDYKPDLSLYYISKIYSEKGNEAKEIETLEKVLTNYPNSKYYSKFRDYVAKYYNIQAQDPYNKANEIAVTAAGSGDAGIYLSKMKDALVLWDKAKTGFEKTLEIDPNNTIAKSAISNMNDQIKAYETYKASLPKK
ncbi:tol-pal system YbgF family protein [Saccharicrinis sp. FJH54]|uniref:tetratricopeptide repeat protein n=1 Tax=Saccharicrinis sp. FJH54 TaxID=3344665 RepID=UPI0035D49443